MSIYDPPADPYGSEKRCRVCDELLEYNHLIRGWECTHSHDAPEEEKPDSIKILEQEIKWSKKHGGESGKGEAFEVGFIAGLKQALYLLNAAQQNTVLSQVEPDPEPDDHWYHDNPNY